MVNITGSDNSTTTRLSSHGDASLYLQMIIITLPGLVSNAFTLYLIVRDLKNVSFPAIFLLFILCIADFTAVISSAAMHILRRFITDVTFEMCVSLSVMSAFFRVYAGCLNMLMACDRMLAICSPFFYRSHVDVKTWKIACMIAALSTFIFTLFPLMGLGNIMDTDYSDGVQINRCNSLGFQTYPIRRVYGIVYGIHGYVVVLTVVVCNLCVIRSVLILNRRVVSPSVNSEPSSGVDSDNVKNAKNVNSYEIVFAKLMGGLAVVYIICGTPYSTLVLLQQAGLRASPTVTGVTHLLAGLAYTVDPIVYILMRKSNRRRIFNMICKCRIVDD